jgi:pimeloyl-ACP methyl ester carboxylesterase
MAKPWQTRFCRPGVTYEKIVLLQRATSRADRAEAMDTVIRQETGGSGDCTIVFLHGLGATAAVWTGARQALEERGGRRWMVADLAGHGGSDRQQFYSVGQLAAQLAHELPLEPAPLIVGHSLGAYVGLALASGWFGVRVRAVLGIGPKIAWPEADLKTAEELRAHARQAYDIPGAGHNAHVEDPRAVLGLIEGLLSAD